LAPNQVFRSFSFASGSEDYSAPLPTIADIEAVVLGGVPRVLSNSGGLLHFLPLYMSSSQIAPFRTVLLERPEQSGILLKLRRIDLQLLWLSRFEDDYKQIDEPNIVNRVVKYRHE
jgi:hypothetical protein